MEPPARPTIRQFSTGSVTLVEALWSQRPEGAILPGFEATYGYALRVDERVRGLTVRLEVTDHQGGLVHSAYLDQTGQPLPEVVEAGTLIRLQQSLVLNLQAGLFALSLNVFAEQGLIASARNLEVFEMACDTARQRQGPVALAGSSRWQMESHSAAAVPTPWEGCTFYHVTHHKAGSQWIRSILTRLLPERIVEPMPGDYQVTWCPARPGAVYPAVYLARHEFYRQPVPHPHRVLVVIRDPRDCLVSGYFSFRQSHPGSSPEALALRASLSAVDREEGMLGLMHSLVPPAIRLQLSWLHDPHVRLVRYEDLVRSEGSGFPDLLLDYGRLPISVAQVEQAVADCRFEKLSGGRTPGQEDPQSHFRRATPGDWRRHFTPRLVREFKDYYGAALVAAGYESDLNWKL